MDEDFNKFIGEYIRYVRTRKHISQDEILDMMEKNGHKMSIQTLKRIENGANSTSFRNINWIADALNIRIEDMTSSLAKKIREYTDNESDDRDDAFYEYVSILWHEKVFYPKYPGIYADLPIVNIYQLITFLPLLIGETDFPDLLDRLCGYDYFGHEEYALNNLRILVKVIPDSPAKKFASELSKKFTHRYITKFFEDPYRTIEAEYKESETDNFRKSEACYLEYVHRMCSILKRLKTEMQQ